MFEDEGRDALIGEPLPDVVALVFDREAGVAAAGDDDDGAAGGAGRWGQVDGEGRLVNVGYVGADYFFRLGAAGLTLKARVLT